MIRHAPDRDYVPSNTRSIYKKADHEGNHERKLEIYKKMDEHYPFMDSADLPF